MKIIKYLSDRMSEELDDACGYIESAIEYKSTFPEVAELLARLSNEEMNHMKLLHAQAERLIAEERKKGEPPAEMMAVYNYLHKKQMDKSARIVAKQTVYKEM